MAFTLLNALSAFVAVARRRSFAAAGRDLGVSTSALSQSVRQLEARLGVTLLTRTSRSVALTEAGERLLARAGPGVDQALESLDEGPAGADGGPVAMGARAREEDLAGARAQSRDHEQLRAEARPPAQVSPALKAFVAVAREHAARSRAKR